MAKNEPDLEVYPCGTQVNFTILGLHATITAYLVRFNRVEYELAYALNGEKKTAWVHESEFTTRSKEKQSIGFKK